MCHAIGQIFGTYVSEVTAVEKNEIRRIRKLAFSKKHSFDTELVSLVNGNKEFSFLKNPVVQNIFKYQIDYLCSFSKKWFNHTDVKILDWGCGKGQISYWLKKLNESVTSCDVANSGKTSAFGTNRQLIENANIAVTELKHEYILPFDNSSFDVALSFGVLEHVPNDLESLKEISRILKPNGLFFCFYLPYKLSYTQNIQHIRGNFYHNKLYGEKTVRQLLEKSSLELMDIWHRALLPKTSLTPPFFHIVERMDNWLCNYSLLKYFATNMEFVAKKVV
jgi:2-polyprenyl-3-methyl-5-hydroxy-6-metoxy-1,4-benzoquinol methylase